MKKTLLVMVVIFSVLPACKKEEPKREPIYGRVLHARSNTPVDNALIRFMSYEPSTGWGNGTYTVIATDTTGPDGTFEIPANEEITDVQAFGLQSIYPDPSEAEYLAPFQASGRPVYLYLEAPGWLRIKGINTGASGHQITSIHAQVYPYTFDNQNVLIDPENSSEITPDARIVKVYTHEDLYVSYKLYWDNGQSEWLQLPMPVQVPGLDTITVEIPY
jgi:hypothetical protein